MGGGGSIGFMNSVIKNNRKLLKKGQRRKKVLGSYDSNTGDRVEFKKPNASPYSLDRLRMKIKEEQKQLLYKRIFVLGLLLSALISVILYYI